MLSCVILGEMLGGQEINFRITGVILSFRITCVESVKREKSYQMLSEGIMYILCVIFVIEDEL